MRGSLRLTYSLVNYLLRQRLASVRRFPLVLMLEITHNCNLTCDGCGRIREYKDIMDKMLSAEECLAVVDECGSPVVSVTGGEPLLHPDIGEIVNGIISKKKHIYLCTNGISLADSLSKFKRSPYLNLNVHLDGLAETHDKIVGARGIFKKAINAIEKAKQMGYKVCTNTTIFKDTDPEEIESLFAILTKLGVDGMLVAPGFSFEDNSNDVFLNKEQVFEKFGFIYDLSKKYRIMNSPLYLKFLKGERELECTPWGNPTRNYLGWKSPCYLITDTHFKSFREFMDCTEWDRYGTGKDPRCKDCMIHCGFEPTVVLETGKSLKDAFEMAKWNFS